MQHRYPASQRNATSFSDVVHVCPTYFTDEISRIAGSDQGSGAYSFKRRYLLEQILSKYSEGERNKSLSQAAFNTFIKYEVTCKQLNDQPSLDQQLDTNILDRARRIMSTLLGTFSYEKVLKGVKHGSGATFTRTRSFGHAAYKYNVDVPKRFFSLSKRNWVKCPNVLSCTPLALKYWRALAQTTLWGKYGNPNNTILVKGNKLDFVPKNSKTDRTIAKEPDINMVLQLGVGAYFTKRLTKFGNCKLDQSRNQQLAFLGSFTGLWATIDLSAASDCISWRLVKELVSPEWFQYLDDIRSHYYLHPETGEWVMYEKFSTMGNGFTFELETMIFLALTLATANVELGDHVGLFSTYGDDIICPTEHAHATIETLNNVGFIANPEKTFTEGPFRESCGKHYYNGIDVTPFYIRKPIDSVERVCWLLNRLREWSYCEVTDVCDDEFYELWLSIYKSHKILRKVRGGRDTSRQDYVVSPGRPTGHLVCLAKKLVIDDLSIYAVNLSQGNFVKPPKLKAAVKVSERKEGKSEVIELIDASRLYHYLIHPETDQSSVRIIPNYDEYELCETKYKFLTELS